ncbi:hypothetical protein GCM10023214_19910 [Amycolatopsis dongchuanensis]|uniref:TNase-like domain-containing protein n=2 Tax=Amycolatopsis dongchuanensis TaxID=1070866 RepID=A0ABP9Q8U9_9PSEU
MLNRPVPLWLKITLTAFGALFTVTAVFGRPAVPDSTAAATPPPLPPHPAATTYTVMSVRGTTVDLADPSGKAFSIRAAGLASPAAGDCFSTESANWASAFLTGDRVTAEIVDTGSGSLAMIDLPDGTNYSMIALRNGYAKYSPDPLAAGDPRLADAETAARQAGTGLWGPPCRRPNSPVPTVTSIRTPPPVTSTGQPPAPPPAAPSTEPTTTTCTKAHPPAGERGKRPCAR